MSTQDVQFHMAAQSMHEAEQKRLKTARRRGLRRSKRILGVG
ncbi:MULTISPECIES: hypothetical protein [Euryhalocaulis]|nr:MULTISPECIES: hypothetical protein [Euryhalocaulis]